MKDINDLLKERNITDYSITEFMCYTNKLTSLEGIEKLINLEILHCYNNQLNSQDLYQQINNNTSIKYINSFIENRQKFLSKLKHKIISDFKYENSK